MPFDVAGSFLMTYGTSYHALVDRASLRAGETVLVLGAAGGIGMAAIEIAKALGARVIAAASSPDKLRRCIERGADEVIDYKAEDLRERIRAITKGQGVDVVCNPVGGRFSEPALDAAPPPPRGILAIRVPFSAACRSATPAPPSAAGLRPTRAAAAARCP
jgi:NADPH:quinone reductase